MYECKGCGRGFEKAGSLNTHKRFCDKWQSLGMQVHKNCLPLEDRKKIAATCPLCNKDFTNVYAMSAHKSHCDGQNSTSHLEHVRAWNKGLTRETDERVRRAGDKRATPLAHILDGRCRWTNTNSLKYKLIREGYLQNKCSICGIYEWMKSTIVCELDHVNGNRYDNSLENLRMLCPNCHSQTNSYCGKNKGKYK